MTPDLHGGRNASRCHASLLCERGVRAHWLLASILVSTVLLSTLASAMIRPAGPQDAWREFDIPVDTRAQAREYLRDLMVRRAQDGERSKLRYLGAPRRMEVPLRGRRDPVVNPHDSRIHSMQDRAERRAYDGAPPVMPHSKNFAKTKDCIECHAQGMYLGSKFARPISHAYLINCEQCHVESKNFWLDGYRLEQENSFAGLRPPEGGTRYTDLSPPVMPHGTFMRTNCAACHGPNGYRGLRTDHPERLNCVQCHAVAAEIDQSSPFFKGEPELVRPRVPARGAPYGIIDPDKLPSRR